MTVWLDAQLSPTLVTWFRQTLDVSAVAVRDLHLRDATDAAIFQAARDANAIVVTKDADFVRLLEQHGPPPQVVWITCGNTSNVVLIYTKDPSVQAFTDLDKPKEQALDAADELTLFDTALSACGTTNEFVKYRGVVD